MNFYLTGSETDGWQFSASIPERYSGYLIPGSTPYFLKSQLGSALLQEMQGLDYTLRYDLVFDGNGLELAFTLPVASVVLLYILDGRINFLDVTGKAVTLEEGCYYLCYITPSDTHIVSFAEGNSVSVQVDIAASVTAHAGEYALLSELRQIMEDKSFKGIFCARPGHLDYRMLKAIDILLKSKGSQWEMELAVQAAASALVKLFVEQLEEVDNILPKQEIKKLEKIRKYISDNVSQQLRMANLARIYGASAERLNKQYRAHYKENLRHYIHKERMEQAMLLLRDKKVTVNEVADMTGYNNANNFTRAFTTYFGITPSSARNSGK